MTPTHGHRQITKGDVKGITAKKGASESHFFSPLCELIRILFTLEVRSKNLPEEASRLLKAKAILSSGF
jgi:hypothetical protein